MQTKPSIQLEKHISDILDTARMAPSVHNSQPWIVTVHDSAITTTIDESHILHDGDPTGRQTIISLGIFTEAIIISAAQFGLTDPVVYFKDSHSILTFNTLTSPNPNYELPKLIHTRSTDRSIYKPANITDDIMQAINTARLSPRVSVLTTKDIELMQTIANLTSRGIRLALSSPGFRDELSHYLVTPGSTEHRGIATKSLYIPRIIQYFEPWLIRNGVMLQAEISLEKRRWQSASAVVLICSDGDLHNDWFEAGQSYLHASLAIEKAGLSQATSAAIVEATDFHEDIEKLMGTNQRIQAVMRIGIGSKKRHYSPRVDVQELLTTSN